MESRTRQPGRLARIALVGAVVLALVGQQTNAAQALDPGQVVVTLAPSAAAALGISTTSAAATTYVALGAVTAAATTAAVVIGAGAIGIAIGWGIVESGLWDWATGTDPVPATVPETTVGVDYGYEMSTYYRVDVPEWEYISVCEAGQSQTGHFWYVWHNTDGTVQGPFSHQVSATGWCDITVQAARIDSGDGRYRQGLGIAPYSDSTNLVTGDPVDADGDGARDYQWWGNPAPGYYAPETGGEPAEDRQLVTELECTDPATSAVTTVTETSALYAPGSEPLTPSAVCPLGSTVTGLTVSRTIDGGDGSQDEDLFTLDQPLPLQDETYGDCLDGSCTLMLHRVRTDGTTEACDSGDVLCVGWITDPARTENYQCLWGTHVMPLGDCEMFHAIDTEAETGTATKPDNAVDSDLGTTTDLPTGAPEPGTEPSGCSPWALINPFSGGIAQGVACALEWAFVPTATSLNTSVIEPLQDAWNATPPGMIVGTATTFLVGMGWDRTNSCSGMVLDLTPDSLRSDGYNPAGGYPDLESGFPTRIGIPCQPPFSWSIPYTVMTSVVALGGILGAYNMVAKTIGAPSEGSSVEFRDTSW